MIGVMRTPRWLAVVAASLVLLGACSGDEEPAGNEPAGNEPAGEEPADDPGSTAPEPPPAEAAGVYGDLANWMCHPDLADDDNRCLGDLDVSVIGPDGDIEVVEHVPAPDPAIDCFYVYPTISQDPSPNSDLVPAEDQEVRALRNQAARLSSVCEVWAPVYRQRTLGALMGGIEVADDQAVRDLAYADVLDAWTTYLARSEPGRGVVLVGHSQGAGLLNRLIREEIDADDERRGRLVSALLLGSSVAVPEGEDVGGDFAEVPLCREPSQIGCVVSYATFRSTAPPPPNSLFGRPRSGGGVAACVNPAALAGGTAPLQGIFPADASPWAEGEDRPAVTTPFFALPGMLEATCVVRDGFSYLELTVLGDPDDPRRDDIAGDLTPEWGLHLVDANVAMGDLVDLVTAGAEAYREG